MQTTNTHPPAHAPKTDLHMPISEFRSTSRSPQTMLPPHWLQIEAPEKTGTLPPVPLAMLQRTQSQYKKAHILLGLTPDPLPQLASLPVRLAQKAPPEIPNPVPCPSSSARGSVLCLLYSCGRRRSATCAAPQSRAADQSGSSDSIPRPHRSK